jgi:NADPH-dependent ferric siderophore reductase
MTTTTSTGRRIERVRHETRRRDLELKAVERVGANFVRVTLSGPELDGFTSLGYDDHLKLFVDPDAEPPVKRDFTPRSYDESTQELVVEFFIHDGGAASDWVKKASLGSRATIGGPRGSMIVPMDYDWYLLVGDETAIPAIARRLEELPVGAKVIALVQATDARDQRSFATLAAADIRWVATGDELVAAVRGLELPAGEGFAWCGTEGGDMVRIREILINEKGHSLDHLRASSYWRLADMDRGEESRVTP